MNERSKYNEVYSIEEVDETVEELWIENNEGTLESVDVWFKNSNKNEVSFISREEASTLHNLIESKFNVDLSVVWNKPTKHYVACIVGKVDHIKDVEELREALFQSSSSYHVTTDFGYKWFILEAAYDQSGEMRGK